MNEQEQLAYYAEVSNRFNVDRFLKNAKEAIKYIDNPVERALYSMMVYLKDKGWIKDWYSPAEFHKCFRQIDVFEHGSLDATMHNLIEASTIVWKIFCEEYKRTEDEYKRI